MIVKAISRFIGSLGMSGSLSVLPYNKEAYNIFKSVFDAVLFAAAG
jgi:hypothetical protein